MAMARTDPFNFDLSLQWASRQPTFACRRTGDRLEYLVDGEPYLRVERDGKFALLYMWSSEPVAPEPYK
jgi:hypothetical protein